LASNARSNISQTSTVAVNCSEIKLAISRPPLLPLPAREVLQVVTLLQVETVLQVETLLQVETVQPHLQPMLPLLQPKVVKERKVKSKVPKAPVG
jgi:hypothetical protein